MKIFSLPFLLLSFCSNPIVQYQESFVLQTIKEWDHVTDSLAADFSLNEKHMNPDSFYINYLNIKRQEFRDSLIVSDLFLKYNDDSVFLYEQLILDGNWEYQGILWTNSEEKYNIARYYSQNDSIKLFKIESPLKSEFDKVSSRTDWCTEEFTSFNFSDSHINVITVKSKILILNGKIVTIKLHSLLFN